MTQLTGYRRRFYFGILLIALGIVMNNTLGSSLGTVLVAVGGLFFIFGMSDKRKEEEV